jgi:zinc transport system substrate-binding protein
MNPKLATPIITGLLLAVTVTASAASCGGGTPAESDKLGVAVTLVPYADFVRQVGSDKVNVTIMVPVGASPHTYEPTPGQMAALSEAEVYVQVGSGVEFEVTWMDNLIDQNNDMLVVDSSAGIELISGVDSGDMGTDPHVWTSPANVKIIVENVCDGLISVDPDNTSYYESNRDSYLSELDDLDEYIDGKLDGYTVRYFLIYHPAFAYFAEEYNLEQLAIEHEGKEPTIQVIQQCIDLAQQHNLDYIYIDPASAPQYAETIAESIGGETAQLNPLPENYIESLRDIADAIALELE